MKDIKMIIESEDAGIRLDKLIGAKVKDISRSYAEKLIQEDYVKLNGKPLSKSYKGKIGDCVELTIPNPVKLEVLAEDIPLDIMYEDSDLLVVNKPKGMVVHPAAGNYSGTLVNALLAYCGDSLSSLNGKFRPGIVHRIDKNTSGLLIVAKNDFAHESLSQQIKAHSFTRIYEAVVHGNIKEDDGTVDAPIGRHPINRKKMAVTEKNSRNAVTHYHVVCRYGNFTHIQCKLETGRTHQIRVHMSYIGHPIAGDDIYGPKKPVPGLNGQCLHARVIGFIHPRDGRYIEITSSLPDYFVKFLNKLQKQL